MISFFETKQKKNNNRIQTNFKCRLLKYRMSGEFVDSVKHAHKRLGANVFAQLYAHRRRRSRRPNTHTRTQT